MLEALSVERVILAAVVVALAVYFCVFCFCATIAHRRRKLTFAERPIITFHEWCQRYYSDLSEREREHTEMVARVFAQEIGVDPSQLEPGDLLLRDYCLKGICSHFDDIWEDWTEVLGNYVTAVRGHEISRDELHPSSSWLTLDDVIRGTIALLTAPETAGNSGAETNKRRSHADS